MITATRPASTQQPVTTERCDSCTVEAHVLVLLNDGGQLGVLIEHAP
jgi:hypothetical protein